MLALPRGQRHPPSYILELPIDYPVLPFCPPVIGSPFRGIYPYDTKIFLLGLSQLKIPKFYRKLLLHILMVAQCLIALNWKQRSLPSLEALYARIKDVELMEKMTARLQDRMEAHNRVWELWHLQEDPP